MHPGSFSLAADAVSAAFCCGAGVMVLAVWLQAVAIVLDRLQNLVRAMMVMMMLMMMMIDVMVPGIHEKY